MITPEMTASEIYKEVKRDFPHVLHALHKGYGGKRKYEADANRMCDDAMRQPEGTVLLGNVESYTSGNTGNNWIVYSYAMNSGFRTSVGGHRQFIWWNTPDGSIAALMFAPPSDRVGWTPIHYTGHFFKRYAEREGLGEVDLQLVIDFIRNAGNSVIQFDNKPQSPGKYRLDMVLHHGIGRGFTIGRDPDDDKQLYVCHVKTYLPSAMLSPIQRQETAEIRAMQASKSRPADTFVSRVMADDLQGLRDYFSEYFNSRCLPEAKGRMFANMMDQIITHEVHATARTDEERTDSALRARLLQLYHRYQQYVYEYVSSHPSKSEHYSMLEAINVAKYVNRDLDVRAIMTSMLDPHPYNHELLDYIERTSAKIEAKFEEGLATGKIK